MGRNAVPSERQLVSRTLIGLGLLMMLASAALAGSQAYKRYEDGYWTLYSTTQMFADIGIPYPRGAWASVQPTINWIMNEPASGVLLCVGIALFALGHLFKALR
jgi:hypothetical protein